MRIDSDFKDYYDFVQALGQEPGVVFDRRRRQDRRVRHPVLGHCEIRRARLAEPSVAGYLDRLLSAAARSLIWRTCHTFDHAVDADGTPVCRDFLVIGFGGRLFGVYVHGREPARPLWSVEDLSQHVPALYAGVLGADTWAVILPVPAACEGLLQPPVEAPELFAALRTPIFALSMQEHHASRGTGAAGVELEAYVNFELRGIGFQRLVEPHAAFHGLQTWIENFQHPVPPMAELTDRERLIKAGFDHRASFRHRDNG